jgi:3-oxoacyl-[acyl-carrier protein] reductase
MSVESSPKSVLPFSLAGRVALVTGSSVGLGKALAFALGKAGARVAINYHNNADRAEKTFKEFKTNGFEGMLVRANVTDETEVENMAAQVARSLGPVDILVLNATCDQPQKPFEDYDWAFFQTMIDFFIKSPFLLTRACLPHMKKQHWGRIINIGTEAVQRGVPNFSAYVAAKGGQNGLHRSLATELAPEGITVNTISPGWIPVERHERVPEVEKQKYFDLIPAKRWGVPSDLAGAVVFLASDAASFVTGQNISVNGGMTVA